MIEQINPFQFGRLSAQDRFTDRDDERKELKKLISSGTHVWLFSPRRYGKTSLIKQVFKELKNQTQIKSFYMDIFDAKTEADLAEQIARHATQELATKSEKALLLAKELFSWLGPKLTLGEDGRPEIFFGVKKEQSEDYSLEKILGPIHSYAEKKQIKLAIAIDEFQQIAQFEDSEKVEARIRKIIQEPGPVSYLFSGSEQHLMKEIFTFKKRPLYHQAMAFPLGLIGSKDLVSWLLLLTKKAGFPFSASLAQQIVETAACHPYHTEKLAYFCFENQHSRAEYDSDAEFVCAVIENVLEREESVYRNYLSLLSAGQRDVLIACASFTGKIPSNDMVREYRLSSRTYLDKTLRLLSQKGLVDQVDESYRVLDIFFKQWLIKKSIQ